MFVARLNCVAVWQEIKTQSATTHTIYNCAAIKIRPMKKYLIAIFTLSLVSSCSYKVDKTNIFKVGEAINESFARQDTSILKEIY